MDKITIGIAGAGAMGSGIAQVAATAGHPVWLFDISEEALVKSKSKLDKIMARLVEKGRISAEQSSQIREAIRYTTTLEDLKDSELVIEAIVERLEVKSKVFESLETIVSQQTILASNTSSLSITSIAAACKIPGRVIGLHFFNPAPLMKLVEVIPAIQTEESLASKMADLMKMWGKYPVIAKDTPGFIVNRIARPYYGEALKIYEEGLADIPVIDAAMTEVGFRMGPFTLMDYIGNDVNYTVANTVFEAFYGDPRYRPSILHKRMMEAGYLGRKSGRGFYRYDENLRPVPIAASQMVLNKEQIAHRIICMLINEAVDALYLQIASREDIETAMTMGVNYPKGLLAWADEIGIKRCVDTLDELYDWYHDMRYRCSPLLRQMAKEYRTFFH